MSRARGFFQKLMVGAPSLRAVPILVVLGIGTALVLGRQAVVQAESKTWTPSAAWGTKLPKGFPVPRVPATNPMSASKVTVGQRLFYDTRLSGNLKQSCSSCHRPELGFTDGRAQAVGSTDEQHPRNAQSLVNVAYQQTLTWANPSLVNLERQMEVPLFGTQPVEMGVNDRNKDRVLARLKADAWYAKWFRRAYPRQKKAITWTTVIRSIAAFERSLISADSRYDRYVRGEIQLTAAERRGRAVFVGEKAECTHCHGSFIFNDQTTFVGAPDETPKFHNTGLYNLGGTGAFPEPNRGVFEVSGRASDMGKFRAPSLRNVALTAPYMHDGSIETLAQAIDHYAAGGRVITDGPLAGDGRANPFKDPLLEKIQLTARDKADLLAFLESLTDRTIATNPRFADPFAKGR